MTKFRTGDIVRYNGNLFGSVKPDGLMGKVVECGASAVTVLWENSTRPSQGHSIEYVSLVEPAERQVLTGGSSPYYSIDVNGVTIECNDLIKALQLPYADGNVLKAVWRIAIDRMGRGKPGTTRLYDAEKIVFFGNDMVEREKANA